METEEFSSEPDADSKSIELDELGRKYHLDVLTSVPDELLDPELVSSLPVEWARSNVMLPIHYHGQLGVLTADPAAVSAQKHLSLLLGRELVPVISAREVVVDSIERCYFSRQDSARDFLRDLDQQSLAKPQSEHRSDDLLEKSKNAPVTHLVNLILLDAVKSGASDVHIEPFESRLRVRYRIDGVLYEQASPPKHMELALISRLKVMAHMDIAEKRLPQDGVARVRIGEREVDIRVSIIPVAEGERVVLRLLNRDSTIMPLSDLGMSHHVLSSLKNLSLESHGIIIVCGPTGSGKTTTLYAALQQLDKSRTNILTIEDPIEYQLPDIGQIQVKPKIGLTFAGGLRHILRQDPDTILVGEIRDLETAEIAIRASLTGHLVFSTLHTNDASGAVIRMIDIGVEPYLVAASLRAVMAQRLIRKLCYKCRQETTFSSMEPGFPEFVRTAIKNQTIWTAEGCSECLEGYHGRTGLFELMIVDQDMSEAIRSGHTDSRKLRELAISKGMITLLDDGIARVLDGQTSLSEVLRSIGKFSEISV